MTESPQTLVTSRLDRLGESLRAAAEHPSGVGEVHALRVATRRFAQCLRVCGAQFDAGVIKKIRRRMRRWMDRCGAVRNCDVTLQLLRQAGLSDRSAAARHVRQVRTEARAALEKHLVRARGRHIEQKWAARLFTSSEPVAIPSPNLPKLTAELFEQGEGAAAKGSTYEQMHEFRLLAKHYRYTLELLGGEAAAPILAQLRKLQNRLGAMNDCVTALALVKGHSRAEEAIQRLLRTRASAFRRLWRNEFGTRRLQEWTSIFSAMVKPIHAAPESRKGPVRSRHAAAKMSAAS